MGAEVDPDAVPAAKVEHRAEAPVVATIKAEEERDRIRVYDSWGCPGATKEIRGALESPSCCSRTSTLLFFYKLLFLIFYKGC